MIFLFDLLHVKLNACQYYEKMLLDNQAVGIFHWSQNEILNAIFMFFTFGGNKKYFATQMLLSKVTYSWTKQIKVKHPTVSLVRFQSKSI